VLVSKIYKRSLIILVALAVGSAIAFEPVKLPFSIMVGGVLAILNFSGLGRGLRKHLDTDRPAMKLLFLSIFRLFIVSSIIIALAVTRSVNLVGLVLGFTVVLAMLAFEGMKESQKEQES
jgi:hypothetical protein